MALALKINDELDKGGQVKDVRGRFKGGDRIEYVIRKGRDKQQPLVERCDLTVRVDGLDDLDMIHYIRQSQRCLSKVLSFFLSDEVIKAVFETLRSTLFLRQNAQRSIIPEEERVASLKRSLEAAVRHMEEEDTTPPPSRTKKQRKLTDCFPTIKKPTLA